MRIAYLSNFYYPFVGGAEEVCRMEAEGLAKRGYDVSVVTTILPEHNVRFEEINKVKVYRVKFRRIRIGTKTSWKSSLQDFSWLIAGSLNHMLNLYNPFAASVIEQIMKKLNPDIIHIHNFGAFSLSAFHVLKKLKVPVIVTLHDYTLICPRATFLCYVNLPCKVPRVACKIGLELNNALIKDKVKLFIAPSRFLADRFEEKLGEVKIEVIPNPVEEIEAEAKKDLNTARILYVGRLEWYKGVYTLLEAFRGLKNKNVELLITGRGPEFETIKRFSHIDSRIIPLGYVPEEEKRRLLKNASLTVVPSLWPEPFSMITLESFASATPVVASKIGGLPEIVEDGYNGRLFRPGDPEELRNILMVLIEDREELKKLQDGAIKSARRYHVDKHAEKLKGIYEELARGN